MVMVTIYDDDDDNDDDDDDDDGRFQDEICPLPPKSLFILL